MKNLKKLLAVLVVIAMVSTFLVPAFADSFSYENEANDMYELGLYKGTSTTEKVLNLGGKLDRQTGVVMILRLFGQEEEALKMVAEDATAKLEAKFSDAADIADWAKKQVAYAVENGFVKGLPDGTFAPKADLNGKAYCTLILQQLGYDGDFTYDTAAFDLKEKGGLSEAEAKIFNSNAGINRDSMVGISYAALQAVYKEGGKTVVEALVDNGNVDETLAKTVGVLKQAIKSVKALDDVKVQIGGTAVLPTEVEVTYADDTTAKLAVTWPTVDTSAVGEQTIEGTIEGYTLEKAKATVKVIVQPAELLVDSVEANNLKEVVVNFNGEVDADKAGTVGNYSVKDNTVALATVSDDKTSVTLTVGTPIAQQASVEVTVKKEAGLTADVTKKIDSVMDTTLPVAESIKLTGPKSFEITFSEPVQENTPEILVNNGVYGVSSKVLSANKKVLTVTLGVSSLAEAKYTVKVGGYKDYANFAIMTKTFELDYVKDTSAPVATLKLAEQNKVEIEFNKEVVRKDKSGAEATLTVDYFYHTYNSWKPTSVATTDNKKFVLTFNSYYLPEGNVTITVLKSAGEVAVVDAWGNEMAADAKLTATVVIDKDAPTITKVEATAEDKVEITFSEDIATNYDDDADLELLLEPSKYVTIKNSKAEAVSQTFVTTGDPKTSYADKKLTLILNSKLDGGTYTVEVKDITDGSLSKNKIATVSVDFTVTDKTPVQTITATYVDTGDGESEYIYVTFSEDMAISGSGSVLDKGYYVLNGAALPDDATIETFGSNKKIKITLPNGTIVTGTLQIGRVADASGNALTALSTEKLLTAESAPTIAKVTTKDLNKIEIKIAGKVTTVPYDGFTVSGSVYNLAAIESTSYVTEEDVEYTLVLGVLRSEVALAGPNAEPSDVRVVAGKVKSDTGMAMAAATFTADIVDGIKPAFVAPTTDTGKKVSKATHIITLTFDEAVTSGNDYLAATDLVVTYDGTALVAGTDYAITTSNATTVQLNITKALANDKKVKVETKSTVNYLKDAAGNTVKAFAQEYTVID